MIADVSQGALQNILTFPIQLKIVAFIAFISLIPFAVMMTTSFTRISIIFQFLRQALGSAQVPSNQIIIALSIILTGFVMHPVIKEMQENAFSPYLKGEFKTNSEVVSKSKNEEILFFEKAWQPLRNFLLRNTREKDMQLFLEIGNVQLEIDPNTGNVIANSIPWYVLVPSFVLSELRTAFMMGFLLFLPFLIIDMVVAAVLMSMGMMMLPPVMISLPFKLLLFILIDGWRLIIQQVVGGFDIGGVL